MAKLMRKRQLAARLEETEGEAEEEMVAGSMTGLADHDAKSTNKAGAVVISLLCLF